MYKTSLKKGGGPKKSAYESICKSDSQSAKSDSRLPKNIMNQLAKVIRNYSKSILHLATRIRLFSGLNITLRRHSHLEIKLE